MAVPDRRAFERELQREFPSLELHKWYIQYRELKAGYPDAVLLYRLGDFYETFDDDAKLAAELLDVTLTYKEFATERATDQKRRCPMAGMPFHSIEGYAARLVGAGYRVAIAEQVSETASSKSDTRPRSVFAAGIEQGERRRGVVDREVVRVLTPGTVVDAGILAAERNNYLAAAIMDGGLIGFAYADLSTGEFFATEFQGDRAVIQAQGELARVQAAEVLTPDKPELRVPGLEPASARLEHDLEFMTKQERDLLLPGERVARRVERESTARWAHGHVTAVPLWRWELRTAHDALAQHFNVRSVAGFGLQDRSPAVRAAGVILQYAQETHRGAVRQITGLHAYTPGEVMFLDPQTRRNLELLEGSSGKSKGSLISVLDQTRTPMGARLLRRWVSQPLLAHERLRARHDAVQYFFDDALLRATVREHLKQIGDLERIVNRVIQGVTITTPRDMVRLREALRAMPAILAALGKWLPGEALHDRRMPPTGTAEAPLPELPETLPPEADAGDDLFDAPRPPSLREQRESKRRVQPRYMTEDLFGDDDLFTPPAPAPVAPRPQRAAARPNVPLRPVGELPPIMLDACADVLAFLEQALDDEPPALLGQSNYLRAGDNEAARRVIRPGFEPQIDAIVAASRDAQLWISALEQRERERTGIKSLRVDYNKVFGYYIEIGRAYADQAPPEYIRKQTLSTGERYYTEELKTYEDIVLHAQERLVEFERRAFTQICETVAAQGLRLLISARLLAAIDLFAGLADVAARNGYVRPELFDDTRLRIVGGRHPVVEQALDGRFVPNDTVLDTETRQILIITGANMTGKSTVMRQVALITLMAQIGSFVPAAHAEIGLVDRIFTRIGAQDDIATGQSTFMVEMTETAALLAQSTRRSLIILDEVGRGTSTYDGMAIARAVIEYIHNEPRLGCRTLFATHYHELTDLEEVLPRVSNAHMAALEQDGAVVFLHELRAGHADRSYGIHVAELVGIPRVVIRRAHELLAELERHGHTATTRLPEAIEAASEAADSSVLPPFDPPDHPVIELIRRLNINELSPIEALTRLYELQRFVSESRPR